VVDPDVPSDEGRPDGAGDSDQVLVRLALELGAASGRREVLQVTRTALGAGLPTSARWAIAGVGRTMAGGPPRPSTERRRGDVLTLHTEHDRFVAHAPDLARQLPSAGCTAWLVAPLRDDRSGRPVSLGVAWTAEEGPGPEAQRFVASLATLVGQALHALEARDRDHELARRLQQSLLPVIPPIAGLAIESHYQPAGAHALAGGDFYDVVDLGDGLTTVLIGDVAGHGVDAAAASGEVRYLARGVLEHTSRPADVLCLVEAALARGAREPTMVTLLCAVMDAASGTLRMASAGHAAPIIRRASGVIVPTTVRPAPPLGAGLVKAERPPLEAVVHFEPGALAVFYTDGLVERRRIPLDTVLEAVEDVVARQPSPAALCAELADFADGDRDHDDDIALLVVQRLGVVNAEAGALEVALVAEGV
jgi:serine phosphatase RsbU (regulator of sigma subunit)